MKPFCEITVFYADKRERAKRNEVKSRNQDAEIRFSVPLRAIASFGHVAELPTLHTARHSDDLLGFREPPVDESTIGAYAGHPESGTLPNPDPINASTTHRSCSRPGKVSHGKVVSHLQHVY